MAIDIASYNNQFMDTVQQSGSYFTDAEKYGIEVQSIADRDGAEGAGQYWRVIGIHHLTGAENMGNHNVFCDVLDENGQRIQFAKLSINDGSGDLFASIDKPANEAGTNFPIWKTTRATVTVAWPDDNPLPSETVTGLRIDHPDEEEGNTWGHHSFYVVFQRSDIGSASQKSEPEAESGSGKTEAGSVEEAIAVAGQSLIILLNPDAMFYKVAQQNSLGERLSAEYDATYDGRTYRAQVYEKGIVYAEVGDWGNVKIIERTN